jgi:DNA (cytosine-5)-methyltransferase 1
MKLVSLFAGVGGFDLAAENVGIEPCVAVEIDNHARGVLAHRFPNATLFSDVKDVTADDLYSAGADPDDTILTAGFPCQPFSIAGKRLGEADHRGELYWEVSRLMGEFRPKYFVLENVPGLLTIDGGRTMGAIVKDLGSLGYRFAYRVLDSRHFGVPQRRRRVFIVGYLGNDRNPGEVLFEPEVSGGSNPPVHQSGKETPYAIAGGPGGSLSGVVEVDPISTLQAAGGDRGYRVDAEGASGGHLIPFVKTIRSGARDSDGNLPPEVWEEKQTAPTLNVFDNGGESRATVVIAFSHINASHPQPSTEVVPTMREKTDGHAVLEDMKVRRLMPIECERLQGFPDGWTEHRIELKVKKRMGQVVEQSDSRRYAQMGNAVTVNVVQWILQRIVDGEE